MKQFIRAISHAIGLLQGKSSLYKGLGCFLFAQSKACSNGSLPRRSRPTYLHRSLGEIEPFCKLRHRNNWCSSKGAFHSRLSHYDLLQPLNSFFTASRPLLKITSLYNGNSMISVLLQILIKRPPHRQASSRTRVVVKFNLCTHKTQRQHLQSLNFFYWPLKKISTSCVEALVLFLKSD